MLAACWLMDTVEWLVLRGYGRKQGSGSVYCGYWSIHIMRDVKLNDVKSHLESICLPISLCVSLFVFSNHVTPGQQLLLQHFYLRSLKDDIVIHAWMCVCVCVSVQNGPKETQTPLCVTRTSSQPRAQVSKWLLKTDGSSLVFLSMCVCVSRLSQNRNI